MTVFAKLLLLVSVVSLVQLQQSVQYKHSSTADHWSCSAAVSECLKKVKCWHQCWESDGSIDTSLSHWSSSHCQESGTSRNNSSGSGNYKISNYPIIFVCESFMSHPLEHIFNILSSSNFLFTHKNYLQQAFSLSAEVRSHVFHHIFSFNQFYQNQGRKSRDFCLL